MNGALNLALLFLQDSIDVYYFCGLAFMHFSGCLRILTLSLRYSTCRHVATAEGEICSHCRRPLSRTASFPSQTSSLNFATNISSPEWKQAITSLSKSYFDKS